MLNIIKKFVPKPLFNFYHLFLAWSGNALYLFPSKKLYLIGVTGTKGKTTTAYFIYQLLENNKYKSALTSTIFFATGKKIKRNFTKMGMPGRLFLPKFLRKAYWKGMKYAVVETTSEGILQHRQRFLDYDTVVFTGLAPEHIERHGGFSAYRKTKEKIFGQCKKSHVINLNDNHAISFLKYPAKQKWGVILDENFQKFIERHKFSESFISRSPLNYIIEGISNPPNKLKIKEWNIVKNKKDLGMQFEIDFPFPGKFNIINFLLAFAASRSAGVPFEELITVVSKLTLPPGRMQEITKIGDPFQVFLDYAHEPLSLKSVLEYCRNFLPQGKKLICLTGSQGGGRDKWKRKVMGYTAAKFCDYVIVGTEDPYQENPNKINQEVLVGVLSHKSFVENKNCWKFSDRREAIQKALNIAHSGDIVVLAGKGGEKKMCIGDKCLPWDEEAIVKEMLML